MICGWHIDIRDRPLHECLMVEDEVLCLVHPRGSLGHHHV